MPWPVILAFLQHFHVFFAGHMFWCNGWGSHGFERRIEKSRRTYRNHRSGQTPGITTWWVVWQRAMSNISSVSLTKLYLNSFHKSTLPANRRKRRMLSNNGPFSHPSWRAICLLWSCRWPLAIRRHYTRGKSIGRFVSVLSFAFPHDDWRRGPEKQFYCGLRPFCIDLPVSLVASGWLTLWADDNCRDWFWIIIKR